MILRVNCVIRDLTPPPARLFFRTGFTRSSRTSKCSNRIEITRVVCKKTARWPRVPLLALITQFNLPLSMRRRRRDARPMNDTTKDISGALRKSVTPKRLPRYISILLVLAALSTVAGYEVARLKTSGTNWLSNTQLLASIGQKSPSLVPASNAGATDADVEAISHLAPQQQAERLLKLAIDRPDQSLGLIHKNLDSWRGHLEDTDQLFHLVLAALDSNDPRVRVAALEIDLVANNLMKSPQSLSKLLNQIHNDPDSRYLALWRLGALGNRGVEPATVLATLLRYSRDSNLQTRFWAVEGLAMLGTAESIDPLLSILAHDPAKQVRERAAVNIARSGMLTGEQRLTAVPQLLNLLDDDSLDPETQDLVYASLQVITGASFGKHPDAWRDWWAHHDRPEKTRHIPKNLLFA